MNFPLPTLLLLSAAGLAAPPSAPAPAPVQPPGRHQIVAGWEIEDVAHPWGHDAMRRAIGLRHRGEHWSVEYQFIEGTGSWVPGRDANISIGSCAAADSVSDDDPAHVEHAGEARARLLALIATAKRRCGRTDDIATEMLAGLDEAFAAAESWDRERVAALAPLRTPDVATDEGGAGADDAQVDAADMSMDTNMNMDTDLTVDVDMNGPVIEDTPRPARARRAAPTRRRPRG
jgi:hypothetical protein